MARPTRSSRWLWVTVCGILFGLILWLNHFLSPAQFHAYQWLLAAEYGVWAVTALGAAARLWPAGNPYYWRPVTIFLGAILSAAEFFSGVGPAPQARIDAWMTALIGIAAVTIIARIVPHSVTRFWYGQETDNGNRTGPSRRS